MITALFFIIYIAFAAACGYLTYYLRNDNPVMSAILLVAAVVFLILAIAVIYRRRIKKLQIKNVEYEKRIKAWNKISYHVDKAGDETFNDLPIGIALYDDRDQFVFGNGYSKTLFESNLEEVAISSISKELLALVQQKTQNFLFKYKDKSYDVIHNTDDCILYLFEVTEREKIKKRYDERITAIGVLEVDNLEESLKNYDMQQKSNIRGKIFGAISDWISQNHCYLQAATGDKMIVMIDQDTLRAMIEDEFSILETIRNISTENRLRSSLSMGIACFDVNYDELGAYAQSAYDLAIKRGGDQIVVNIQGEKVKFFGGVLNAEGNEDEKKSNSRSLAQAVKLAVEESSNVIVMCHRWADTDAIGSALAAHAMVKSSNKDVKIAFDPAYADSTVKKIWEQIKENPHIAEKFVTLNQASDLIGENTLLVVTDTQHSRMVMFPELINLASKLVIIDHHRASDDSYDNFIMHHVDTTATSTVEILADMFVFYSPNIEITPLEASIMLSGVIVDSNNFTVRTSATTFLAASYLKEKGADMVFVRKLLQEPVDSEKKISEAILKMEYCGEQFGIVALDNDKIDPDRTFLAKISDKQLEVQGIMASFTIGRLGENEVGISARSLAVYNVQQIMEQMRGGGHFNSAAAQIKDKTVEEVKEELTKLLRIQFVEGGTGNMKVILTADVKGKGKKDAVIEVANGYANYLITNNLAKPANDENLQQLKVDQEHEKQALENKKAILRKLGEEIATKKISIDIKLGAGGKSFGNITTKLVCDEFFAQTGIKLDKRKVELPGDIKTIGIFTVTVKLDTDITSHFEVEVKEAK